MPWIEVEEGHEEVQPDGGGGGDDQVGEEVVAQFQRGRRGFELEDDDVKGGECGVSHDYRVHDQTGHEHLFGSICGRRDQRVPASMDRMSNMAGPCLPLRSIAHGEDELSA